MKQQSDPNDPDSDNFQGWYTDEYGDYCEV